MANGRNKLRKGDAGRDSGGFVALPWADVEQPTVTKRLARNRASPEKPVAQMELL
jgi:hypothetical protein